MKTRGAIEASLELETTFSQTSDYPENYTNGFLKTIAELLLDIRDLLTKE